MTSKKVKTGKKPAKVQKKEKMTEEKRHEHPGMSSRGDFDDEKVLLMAGLEVGQVLLDVGCGDGHLSIAASKLVGQEGRVMALDSHQSSIESLKRELETLRIKNIEVILKDITKEFSPKEACLDMIIMANVLHGFVHNKEHGRILKKVDRSLKRSGRLAIIEFKKEETEKGPPIKVRISNPELISLLSGYKFDILLTQSISPSHYLSVFQKSGK